MKSEELLEFARLIGKLKKIPRSGWLKKVGVNNPESVAEHVFRQSILCMIVGDMLKLNTEKMIRMALLDDLHEAIIGDLMPEEQTKVGEKEYRNQEISGTRKLLSFISKELVDEYFDIWNELHQLKSEEAKIVRQLDKIEMVIQSLEYEEEGHDKKKLDEFWVDTEKRITDKELIKLFNFLKHLRRDRYGTS